MWGRGDGFADGRCVRCVILATLTTHALGRHELGSHQSNRVAVLMKQPRPVVCTGAGFHADDTRR